MSLEQVSLDIMNVNFNINTPAEEKDTLLQAVDMLNKKIEPFVRTAASSVPTKLPLWPHSTSSTTY